MKDLLKLFKQQAPVEHFDSIKIGLASPEMIRAWSYGEVQEARDHQLPHLQAGARRPVLRQDLRPGQGLRVPVRQVQAPEAPRRGLREVRRRGDAVQGAPRAHGPHRAGQPDRAHLVPEVAAVAHRPDARHDAARDRARAVLRGLRGHRSGHDADAARPAADRRDVPRGDRGARRRVRRPHGRRGRVRAAAHDRSQRRDHQGARGDGRHLLRDQAQAPVQAPEADRVVPRVGQQARVDGA